MTRLHLTNPGLWLAFVFPTTACLNDMWLGAPSSESKSSTGQTDPSTTDNSTKGFPEPSGETVDPSTTDAEATTTSSDSLPEPETCAQFSPPPIECPSRSIDNFVTFAVDGDSLPIGTDQPCTVAAFETVDDVTSSLTLACDASDYTLTITAGEGLRGFLDVFLTPDRDVRLTAREAAFPIVQIPSFVIRDTSGALLFGRIHEVGEGLFRDEKHFELVQQGFNLAPIRVSMASTGCPGFDVAETCEGDGSILSMRWGLHFSSENNLDVIVYDGQSSTLYDTIEGTNVIVNRAERIACWDIDCLGDDSGPFDVIDFILVPYPPDDAF